MQGCKAAGEAGGTSALKAQGSSWNQRTQTPEPSCSSKVQSCRLLGGSALSPVIGNGRKSLK